MQFETLQFFTAKAYGIGFSGIISLCTKLGFKELLLQNKNESYEKILKLLTFFPIQ